MTQTGTKIPTNPWKLKECRGQRAPTAPCEISQAFPHRPWSDFSREGSGRETSSVSLSVPFPYISSGISVALTPKHGRIFPPPPTRQGNDSFTSENLVLQLAGNAVLGVHPLQSEIWAVLTGHWVPRVPVLMKCNRWGKKTFLMQTLSLVKFLVRGNPMAAGNVQLPQDLLPKKVLFKEWWRQAKVRLEQIYLQRQRNDPVKLGVDFPSAALSTAALGQTGNSGRNRNSGIQLGCVKMS